jgi:hypothetical protein
MVQDEGQAVLAGAEGGDYDVNHGNSGLSLPDSKKG